MISEPELNGEPGDGDVAPGRVDLPGQARAADRDRAPDMADEPGRGFLARWGRSRARSHGAISEVELEYGPGAGPGTDVPAVPASGDEPGAPPPADVIGGEPAPSARRHWRWALGGVAVASALWATGLYAYANATGGGPDLHGYHVGANPCAGRAMKPLTDAIGDDRTVSNPEKQVTGPALDLTRCEVFAHSTANGGWAALYRAEISVELHKKTDPRGEFEDERGLREDSLEPPETIRTVAGLGDRAYLVTATDAIEMLKVLHGGAVFTLTVTGDTRLTDLRVDPEAGQPDPPNMDRLQPGMIASVRNIMAALRS
jgi:hypothetical protein